MMTTRELVSAAMMILAATTAAAPQSAVPVVDVQTIGPSVGKTVPTFELPDQKGQPRSLESIMGPKGAMLVFFRSADW